jgi:hypothetical protein
MNLKNTGMPGKGNSLLTSSSKHAMGDSRGLCRHHFVTEDFSKSKQVKLDRPEAAGADRLPVLKLNLVKKFNTGIYPYSLMLSVFSPVDISASTHAVKTVASVQEWCGMTFTQINNKNGKYETTWNSYFESEGDGQEIF